MSWYSSTSSDSSSLMTSGIEGSTLFTILRRCCSASNSFDSAVGNSAASLTFCNMLIDWPRCSRIGLCETLQIRTAAVGIRPETRVRATRSPGIGSEGTVVQYSSSEGWLRRPPYMTWAGITASASGGISKSRNAYTLGC